MFGMKAGLVLAVLVGVAFAENECETTGMACKQRRFDVNGCECACPWRMKRPATPGPGPEPTGPGSYDTFCTDGCCNPDNEPAGDWCFHAVNSEHNKAMGDKCGTKADGSGGHGTCAPLSSPPPAPKGGGFSKPITRTICSLYKVGTDGHQVCVDPSEASGDWTCACSEGSSITGPPRGPADCSAASNAPATSQQGPTNCGEGGYMGSNCCVCRAGWKKSENGVCDQCSEGFYGPKDGICTDGRVGSPCLDEAVGAMGCAGSLGHGMCSRNAAGEKVFPCVCQVQNGLPLYSEGTNCQHSTSCLPHGANIYTPYPNRPVADEPFNMLVVGCDLKASDEYMILPKGQEADPCGQADPKTFPAECSIAAGEPVDPSPDCSAGFVVRGGLTTHTRHGKTLRATITNVTLSQEYLNSHPTGSFEYALCVLEPRMTPKGTTEEAWRLVDGHNEVFQNEMAEMQYVNSRDSSFVVDPVRNVRGSPKNSEGGSCCEGLRLGSLCIPLWAFLLIWVLMALCLGALGFALHKNNREIEANKNNSKYENFEADNEMLVLAADRDEDDDL